MQREEKERELQALLHSGVVREKTQLHALLSYLGNEALEESHGTLKEHRIGVEALGKPPDYDPRIDPSVRVEVAKLRKKLEEFYRNGGAGHPVHLVIPKGSYLPAFAPAAAAAGTTAPRFRFSAERILIAALVLAAILPWLFRTGKTPRLPSELNAFWAPHFDSTPTLLVYGAPLFLKMQGKYYRDPDLNRPEDFAGDDKAQLVLGALKPRETRPAFTFTGVGEAEALFHLSRVLAQGGADLLVQRSNTVDWDDLKGEHVVFLGGRKYNPQIPELPFKPKFEAVSRKIVNLEPKNGEPAEYRTASVSSHGELTEEYALISVYPGFSQHTRLVILDCSSTEGTLAAAEFVTRPDMIRQLIDRGIPMTPESGRVRAFQVVIRARLNKGVVVELAYTNHRTIS